MHPLHRTGSALMRSPLRSLTQTLAAPPPWRVTENAMLLLLNASFSSSSQETPRLTIPQTLQPKDLRKRHLSEALGRCASPGRLCCCGLLQTMQCLRRASLPRLPDVCRRRVGRFAGHAWPPRAWRRVGQATEAPSSRWRRSMRPRVQMASATTACRVPLRRTEMLHAHGCLRRRAWLTGTHANIPHAP